MTDALVAAMDTPGALAVALVELKTGKAIAGDGIEKIDIDLVTPGLTDFLIYQMNHLPEGDIANAVQDIVISTENQIHIMRPLSREAEGLYLYLALDRVQGALPLARRQLAEIDTNLQI